MNVSRLGKRNPRFIFYFFKKKKLKSLYLVARDVGDLYKTISSNSWSRKEKKEKKGPRRYT